MPRITVKGLTAEKKVLEEEITVLLQKNDELQVELESRRDRSRSRRRKAEFKFEPISARTMRALDIVCKRDRDPVIDEQRKTIAKQAQEIEGLKRRSQHLSRHYGSLVMSPIKFLGQSACQ